MEHTHNHEYFLEQQCPEREMKTRFFHGLPMHVLFVDKFKNVFMDVCLDVYINNADKHLQFQEASCTHVRKPDNRIISQSL